MNRFFQTDDSVTLFAQRALLALVMFPHGAQKLLGWFGGYGFAGTVSYFESTGIPWLLAVLVVLAESFGAVLLLAGLGTRLAAFGISAVMVGAMLLVHLPFGFFMNWFGGQGGEGVEFHLLALALSLPLVVRGGGAFSADRWLARAALTHLVVGGRRAAA